MAGAGYKLFNTGDVLTAAQVNTYLMEQTVMVFADAAARTTALTGVVSEGMISYLKDTNAVEVYNGSAWVASDDPNAIQNTIVDAKGDLIAASANDTPARLAVGNNGDTLLADSSTSTGLRWQPTFAAGKNKIINGDMFINQRNFTSATGSTDAGFTVDRFYGRVVDGSVTTSVQAFTTGTAPVSGYEARQFLRMAVTTQTATSAQARFYQPIENVRTLAGETATISFWAKAGSGTPKIAVEFSQNFGSGGSPSAGVNTYAGQVTLSTSWARYSLTVAVPSISGKTLGTTENTSALFLNLWLSAGSDLNSRTGSLGIQNSTFDIWGVQVESGNVATAFQTATGTLQGEFLACARYYQRLTGDTSFQFGAGIAISTTAAEYTLGLMTPMRAVPTISYSNIEILLPGTGPYPITALTLPATIQTPAAVALQASGATGLTQNRPYHLRGTASGSFVAFSSEL